ncbi:MAG: cell division protein FtsL [Nitrospirae bacterium GWC2_57_13]|nr:MAG: cell division protein FtsL [Nitrospirae bacterium GWC2_57_13]HAS55054.1 cell division protein FtsL [Nitrospiraceae bacterium]
MSIGVASIGSFFFEQSKRGSLRRVMALALIVLLLLFYVGWKAKFVQLGYRIESLGQEKRDLERTNRGLRIEASSLSSQARIEQIAIKRLGMVRPAKENVVVVKRKE